MLMTLLQATGGLGGLGSILGAAGGSLSILKYAIYIIPAIIIGFFGWLWWSRRKSGGKSAMVGNTKGLGQNVAYIVSLNHRVVVEKRPFNIKRVYDKDKNIETTRAIFPMPQARKSIVEFIKAIFNRGKKSGDDDEDGPVFSEALAIYDKERDGWFTAYTLETNTQITPFMMGDIQSLEIIKEIERNTERRVARLKSAQLAIQNYVQNATPIQAFGQMQLIGMILLFIGIIALAITLSNIATQIGTLHTVLAPLAAAKAAASTSGP